MSEARLRAALALLSGALFLALLWISGRYLTPGGLDIFDGRPAGYTLEEARIYLRALDETGRAVYLGVFRGLDTLFPVAFAGLLALMLRDGAAGFGTFPRLLLLLLPGAYLVMDLAENALVAGLLQTAPEALTAPAVQLASRFSVTKYSLLAVNVVALVILKFGIRR